jgi:hypothetical protein
VNQMTEAKQMCVRQLNDTDEKNARVQTFLNRHQTVHNARDNAFPIANDRLIVVSEIVI